MKWSRSRTEDRFDRETLRETVAAQLDRALAISGDAELAPAPVKKYVERVEAPWKTKVASP